jgi:hypothetical protein
LAILISFCYVALEVVDRALYIQQFYSGWAMMAMMSVLLAFYLKKRLSILPIGSNASWAQLHYYVGLLLAAVFLMHIEFALPTGNIEIAMACLLLLVICTGVVGTLLNRVFARRLAFLPEEVIYERLGQHRQTIKNQAESIILGVVEKTSSSTLSDFYVEHLLGFFSAPKNFVSHVVGSDFALLHVQSKLEQQIRYLNADEAECAFQLQGLIKQKNTLDQHWALQGVLKYWGSLHMPVALMLIVLIFLHVVLVYAFRGAG